MGVLRCDRGDCENIMCDRYSGQYGYICHECFKELVAKGVRTNIEDFMQSDIKENYQEHYDATFKYFDSIFSER